MCYGGNKQSCCKGSCQLRHLPRVWTTAPENRPHGGDEAQGTPHRPGPKAQLAHRLLLLVGCLSKALQGGCFHHCLAERHDWISDLEEQQLCSGFEDILGLKICLKPLNASEKKLVHLPAF